MFHEKWKKDAPLNIQDSIKIIHAIPDNWYSLSGSVHAPLSRIEEGKVSFRTIAIVKGPGLRGNNTNSYELGYCPFIKPSIYSDSPLDSCFMHKGAPKRGRGGIDEMLIEKQDLCGVFFEEAAGNTYRDDFKDKKKLMDAFVAREYYIARLDVQRGVYQILTGRERKEMPRLNDTERFFLNNMDGDFPFAFLDWDPEMGMRNHLDPFRDVLTNTGFVLEEK